MEMPQNQDTGQNAKGVGVDINAKQKMDNANGDSATAEDKQDLLNSKNRKHSFASLFKDNRAPVVASLLKYIEPPCGEIVIGCDEIETVERTFGYCLLGYVMGSRPSAFTVLNFVKRWGGDVKFLFEENGWIKFQFANEQQRDSVLNGGPYLLAGRQLFLKKMPSCFLYSKDDMVFLPSWVQIYGLPADCWTAPALSRIASVVGKPIHTDQLTISKKGSTYARVLVEIDAKKSRVWECPIRLPTGKMTVVKFKYELDPKFCNNCNSLGHCTEACGVEYRNRKGKQQMKQSENDTNNNGPPAGMKKETANMNEMNTKKKDTPESSNRYNILSPDEDMGNHQATSSTVLENKKGRSGDNLEQDPEANYHAQQNIANSENNSINHQDINNPCPYVGMHHGDVFGDDDLWSMEGTNDPLLRENDFDYEDDELDEVLSRVKLQDHEEWKIVSKKHRRIKNKMRSEANKSNEGNGASSMDTEYVPIDPSSNLPMTGEQTRVFMKHNTEARRPYTAFRGK